MHDLRPETVPLLRKPDGAELQNRGTRRSFPPPPTTAEPGFAQFLTPGFGHAAANRQPGRAKVSVLHPLCVRAEVVDLGVQAGISHINPSMPQVGAYLSRTGLYLSPEPWASLFSGGVHMQ